MQYIPKVFHLGWIGETPLPKKAVEYVDGWRELHPDWKFILWTDPEILALPMLNRELYNLHTNPGLKSDILRYELLEQFGGVWLDIDMEPRKCITPLLKDVLNFAAYEVPRRAGTAIMGSVPKSLFTLSCIDAVKKYADLAAKDEVLTGPMLVTEIIRRVATVTMFPSSMFYPYSWMEKNKAELPYPDAFAVHRWWNTWAYKG